MVRCKATLRNLELGRQCMREAVLCGFCITHYRARMRQRKEHVKKASSLDYLRNDIK